jgi:ABC-type Fe3+-hydroxamate transport system substrate-binding protein
MSDHIDAIGRVQPAADPSARIVCLVPSLTELLCELGCAGRIVGRTRFCIHPRAAVAGIPTVGGTKDVDLDKVARLAPTHAVVNIDENRKETAEALAGIVPHVIVTHPRAPEDNPGLYRLLGGIFGCAERAEALCQEFERAYEAVRRRPATPAERVLYLIWREPWMTVSRDTYISRTLALFGWHTEPADAAERYPKIDLSAFAGRVDRVFLSSEPYPFRDRHLAEVRERTGTAEVALIDGEMTSWYGSRAIAGLRYLLDYTASRRLPR